MRDWLVTFEDDSTITVESITRDGAISLAEGFIGKTTKDAREV